MLPVLALCLVVSGGMAAPVTAPHGEIRPEPGAVMLPHDRPTIQAVVADLRGTGARDLVRLVEDGRRGRVVLEVWSEKADRWGLAGEAEVVPEAGDGVTGDLVFGGAPARLIVRAVGAAERVTLVRQPHFRSPGTQPPCCMLLHDVVVGDEGVVLATVGSERESVDAIIALDLDGDGTDELLASRSLPPLGRTAYPSQALVFRWQGERFGAPTLTELPIGSGDTPFVLGETDGRPGEEAALITTAARSVLYRLSLAGGDRVRAESAGLAARAATAVPAGDDPAVAVIGPVSGLMVATWPAGEPVGEPLGSQPLTRGRLLGPAEVGGGPAILVEEAEAEPMRAYRLPDLAPIVDPALAGDPHPAPAVLRPYRGSLPGGEHGGGPALVVDGWLLRHRGGAQPAETVAFAGARPIGAAGPNGAWMAVAHGLAPGAAVDPDGGRLAGTPPATGSVSLAPIGLVVAPEPDGRSFEPDVHDAVRLDDDGTLAISPEGFRVAIDAPPGSRVHAGVGDGSAGLGLHHVPDSGRLEIRVPLPQALLPYGGERVLLAVVTPAGASYTASLEVLALTGPPPLTGSTRTPLGSTAVRVEGRTVPYATVAIDGRAASVDGEGRFAATIDLPPWPTTIEVVAIDPLGNEARTELTGIGLLDYRALPWIPIAVGLVLAAGVVLFLRVPRPAVAVRHGDASPFEELDPDERI